jgi:uncharacterized membrane protein YphA (DoxX/SURF4 family)
LVEPSTEEHVVSVVLWVLQILLALAFAAAGTVKLVQTKEALAPKMGWVEDWSPAMVKVIGALEILAAIGLVLPPAVNVLPILAALAAAGLVIVMIGAIVTHVRRQEIPGAVPSVVLLVLAAVVAWGRFGPYHF